MGGGNIPGSELMDSAADLCVTKCAVDSTLPGCSDMDTADSGALCIPESKCRELCSLRTDCFGIDVFLGGERCFLNVEGSAPDGCKSQYENADLGPSTSYKFLAKAGTTVERMLQDGTGLSSDLFRRRTCYNMFHGGLMCSDSISYPTETPPAS